jgi:hypothetical protein
MVGGARRQTSVACQMSPHRAEPHPNSPATAVGAYRHASMPGQEVPVAATPRGAATGLARKVGGAHRHRQHAVTQDPVKLDAVARREAPVDGRAGLRRSGAPATLRPRQEGAGVCGSRRHASALGPGPPRQCSSAREHRSGARGANTIAVPRRVAAHRAGIPVDHRRRIEGRSPPRQHPGP